MKIIFEIQIKIKNQNIRNKNKNKPFFESKKQTMCLCVSLTFHIQFISFSVEYILLTMVLSVESELPDQVIKEKKPTKKRFAESYLAR